MKKIWSWLKKHVRPSVRWHKQSGKEINVLEDSLEDIASKAKDKVEAGITIRFKF